MKSATESSLLSYAACLSLFEPVQKSTQNTQRRSSQSQEELKIKSRVEKHVRAVPATVIRRVPTRRQRREGLHLLRRPHQGLVD